MKIDKYLFQYFNMITEYCMEFWKIGYKQMMHLTKKYKLAELINDNIDYLDMFGPQSMADIIRECIERDGGSVYELF